MSKEKIGHMACPDCAEKVAVKRNTENGTLSYSCDECDGSGYCKKTEGRYASWEKRITALPGAQPKPAPAAKPAAKPAASKSSLDDLMQ